MVAVIILINVLFIFGGILIFGHKNYSFANQYVNAESCKELFSSHEETFDFFIHSLQTNSSVYGGRITFDSKGDLEVWNVKEPLKSDQKFIEAVNEIYSDDLFEDNPNVEITFGEGVYGDYVVDFLMFVRDDCYGGITYHKLHRDNDSYHPVYEEKINDHWYWYCYPCI